MQKSLNRVNCALIGGAVIAGISSIAAAAPAIDGTLDMGAGYTLVSTQTNVTSSPTDGGGPGGVANEAGPTSTNLTQVSNAYSYIDPVANTLNLFVGGSLLTNDQGVSHYIIALQTKSGGVTSLAGQHIAGSVYEGNGNDPASENTGNDGLLNVGFDTGFAPNALFVIDPAVGAYTGFTDLTGGGATDAFTVGFNNALLNTAVGAGGVGDPGFAAANTGLELSIPLSTLGYTPGTAIEATIFTTNGGQDGRTNNQVLSPFAYGTGPSDYDYTYIDANRQFNNELDYPGNQYFVIPGAAVPEPASLGLIAVAGASLLGRRTRKA